MEEIEFRGMYLGEWIYGGITKIAGEYFITNSTGPIRCYNVDQQTIEQYTGEIDKSKNKMYKPFKMIMEMINAAAKEKEPIERPKTLVDIAKYRKFFEGKYVLVSPKGSHFHTEVTCPFVQDPLVAAEYMFVKMNKDIKSVTHRNLDDLKECPYCITHYLRNNMHNGKKL